MPLIARASSLTSLVVIATKIGVAPPTIRTAYAVAQKHPDVLAAKVRSVGVNKLDFDVTVSSPYDTPQRYANGFRVLDKKRTVYGERKLWHDHAGEQLFTRDLYGVKNPVAVRSVVIQTRDQRFGYGGKTIEVALPGR